ncbi:uncharacterized protein LOC130977536 [Arachis stenosperma]|uniref:uncharacterized protein LOC130977536 n=1 Tax=Arachis stenosperma TaxID=217475 RepID=UPI0025AB877A|nr:uncharacterized protein LOC130977536 [Arachis stenosperma]
MRVVGTNKAGNIFNGMKFADWLLSIGDGTLGDNLHGESIVCIPEHLILPSDSFQFKDLVDFVYLDLLADISNMGSMESELTAMCPDILNSINYFGIPPHVLVLKIGSPIMLLRNIDQSNGLCNGTRLQVRKLGNHVIECSILIGSKAGEVVLIP